MKQNSKLRQNEQQETTQQQQSQKNTEGKEFSSVEEILRYDAAQHPVPPHVAEKLNESVAKEIEPTTWWKRLVCTFRAK